MQDPILKTLNGYCPRLSPSPVLWLYYFLPPFITVLAPYVLQEVNRSTKYFQSCRNLHSSLSMGPHFPQFSFLNLLPSDLQ